MKKPLLGIGGIGLALACACWVLAPARPAGGQYVLTPRGWEYARLIETPTLATLEAGGHATDSKAGQSIVDHVFDIYHRLGGQHLRDGFTTVDLLNFLGEDGWELVMYQREADGSGHYLLKRQRR